MTLTLSPEKTGTWALHEVLTSAQVNKIASELVKAVDGVGGGVYTLSIADLTLTGTKAMILDLAAQLTAGKVLSVDGHIDLSNSGRINLASGAVIGLNAGATLIAGSGAIVELDSGAALNATIGSSVSLAGSVALATSGVLAAAAGSLHTLAATALLSVADGGEIRLARVENLTIASEVCTLRHTLTPQWIQKTTGPTGTEVWYDFAGNGTWEQCTSTSTDYIIRFALRLNTGEELTSIFATCAGGAGHNGGHGGVLPDNMPALQLVKVSPGGTRTVIARTVDASANATAYDATHPISLTHGTETSGLMPATVTTDPHYIEFLGEWGGADTSGKLVLTAISCVTKQRVVRSPTEFN